MYTGIPLGGGELRSPQPQKLVQFEHKKKKYDLVNLIVFCLGAGFCKCATYIPVLRIVPFMLQSGWSMDVASQGVAYIQYGAIGGRILLFIALALFSMKQRMILTTILTGIIAIILLAWRWMNGPTESIVFAVLIGMFSNAALSIYILVLVELWGADSFVYRIRFAFGMFVMMNGAAMLLTAVLFLFVLHTEQEPYWIFAFTMSMCAFVLQLVAMHIYPRFCAKNADLEELTTTSQLKTMEISASVTPFL